jgi:hypothetical protein
MITYRNRKFECLYDRDSAAVFENLSFETCEFVSCGLSITRDPTRRSTIRNVRLSNCTFRSGGIDAAFLEDIEVNGLHTRNLLQVFGAALKHVTLKGRIGQVIFSPLFDPVGAWKEPEVQATFARANASYYRSVDWAIDIREADAEELELTGIPGRLVR